MLKLKNINLVLLLSAATLVCGEDDLKRIDSLATIADNTKAAESINLPELSEQNAIGTESEIISEEDQSEDDNADSEEEGIESNRQTTDAIQTSDCQTLKKDERKSSLTVGKVLLGVAAAGAGVAAFLGIGFRLLKKAYNKRTFNNDIKVSFEGQIKQYYQNKKYEEQTKNRRFSRRNNLFSLPKCPIRTILSKNRNPWRL